MRANSGNILNLKLLAIYIIKQALIDLEDQNYLWKLDAFWFLTSPSEEEKVWMWLADIPPESIKAHVMKLCANEGKDATETNIMPELLP